MTGEVASHQHHEKGYGTAPQPASRIGPTLALSPVQVTSIDLGSRIAAERSPDTRIYTWALVEYVVTAPTYMYVQDLMCVYKRRMYVCGAALLYLVDTSVTRSNSYFFSDIILCCSWPFPGEGVSARAHGMAICARNTAIRIMYAVWYCAWCQPSHAGHVQI